MQLFINFVSLQRFMAKKIDIHKWIGVFLIVIGVFPFLGIRLGIFTTVIHLLTIVSGVIILLTK
ncbi:hypothetical protein JXA48_03635 [Candidatus Woesearchaeota archaeon]|nr:hypothetical protein [Candidatus Woesearchaeota archaeon]